LSAEALALAEISEVLVTYLEHPEARQHLIEVMRRSPWVEHKVTLSAYVAEVLSVHRGLLGEAARRVLAEGSQLLPEMDFYVPDSDDRASWTGGGSVRLISHLSSGGVLRRQVDDAPDRESDHSSGPQLPEEMEAREIKLLLHPAEPKAHRIGAESGGSEYVISGAPSTDFGLVVKYTSPLGGELRVDVGEEYASIQAAVAAVPVFRIGLSSDCDPLTSPEGCDSSGGGGGSSWGTYATFFQNFWIKDHPLLGAAEVELKFWQRINGVTQSTNRVTLQFYGAEPGDVFIDEGGCPLFGVEYYAGCIPAPVAVWASWAPVASGDEVQMHLMEIDGNGLDELFHTEYLAFDAFNDITWVDSPFDSLDKCDDGSTYRSCAGGNIRYIYN
jgi:hypothetical protein